MRNNVSEKEVLYRYELRRQILMDEAREGNLLAFTKLTMPEYSINWHHKLIAKYLNKFIRREIRRLMIFTPPRYGKSELTSRRLPALLHGLYPNEEILAMSYNSELASDMTVDCQRIMDKPTYHEIFPNSRITAEGSISKYARSANEHELLPVLGPELGPFGSYRSAGVGGAFTGRGGDWILIDDPIKNRDDADSKAFRDRLHKFYTSSLHTRLEGEGSILLTQTCWHIDDLAGRLLTLAKADQEADKWVVLRLPAIKENNDNPEDPRQIGEPLWPAKFSMRNLISSKANSSRDWAALYQQRPTADGGNIIQSSWIKRYKVAPQKFDQMIQVWDFAAKDKTGSDYAVGQVWGRIGSYKYLLHQVRGRWSFPDSVKMLVSVSLQFPNAFKKIVEAKANGPAVMQTLRQRVSGLVEYNPDKDKVARLNAVAPEYESGCVWYPTSELCPWIDEHITELCDFPSGANDDQVDCASMAVDELRKAKPLYHPQAGHGSGVVF